MIPVAKGQNIHVWESQKKQPKNHASCRKGQPESKKKAFELVI